MSYQVTEFQFEESKPLYASFNSPAVVVTSTTQECFVNLRHQQSVQNSVPLRFATLNGSQVIGANGCTFYIVDGDRTIFEKQLSGEILEIYANASGAAARMKSSTYVKSGADEYELPLPLRELVHSREGLYGLCKNKLVSLTRIPQIVMDCALTRVFYDGFALGINSHKRLSLYDQYGCRGYFAENLKIKRFVVLDNNILVCFTKDERIITLGLQLEYRSVKFVIIGNISSAVWQQGSSQRFVEAQMLLGKEGISIIRDSSVLLVSLGQIQSKIDQDLLSQCKNEYELIKLTATCDVDCSDLNVAESLKNTYQVLQGIEPFRKDIREYKQVMQRFCAMYQLALNEQNGAQIDFNPFIDDMIKNLMQIQEQFVAFIRRKIPLFELAEGKNDEDFMATNQELFLEFAENFDVEDYDRRRQKEIIEYQQFYCQKTDEMLADVIKGSTRPRIMIDDSLCGIEEPEEEFEAPASDPPAKKVVKKVIVKKVIRKVVKSTEEAEVEEPPTEEVFEEVVSLPVEEVEPLPTEDPLAGKPKVKKITSINKVVIKRPEKAEESTDEEYAAFEEREHLEEVENELISCRQHEPEVTMPSPPEIQEPKAQSVQTAADDEQKKKVNKISFINKIKFNRAAKEDETADGETEESAEQQEEIPEPQEPQLHIREHSHSSIRIDEHEGAAQMQALEADEIAAEQLEPEIIRRPSQGSMKTDFQREVAAEYGLQQQVIDPDFVPSFFTSPLLRVPPVQQHLHYNITDASVLESSRNNALAQLETFNTFTRAQELLIFDKIFKSILKQVMMVVPSHSIMQERFVILPTENAADVFFLRAYDLRLHREVACRVLPGFMNHKANQYFINKLEHPNLIRILSVGTIKAQNGKMQCAVFVEKPYEYSLKQILEHRLRIFEQEGQVRYFAKQVLQLLKYLNSSRMHLLHRDVSPEQIFVNPDTLEIQLFHTGEIRATDFNEPTCEQTIYAAPEILCGIAASESDVWSLGVCIFRLLELVNKEEPISLFEAGGFGLNEAPPPGSNGEVLTATVANCCVCIANQVANASDFVKMYEGDKGCICSNEHAIEFVARYGNRIQIMPATGKMPWDIEQSGFDREDVITSLGDVSESVKDFLKACWVFDYENRLEAEWMLALAWIKEEK